MMAPVEITNGDRVSPLRSYWLAWAISLASLIMTFVMNDRFPTNDDTISLSASIFFVVSVAFGVAGLFGIRCPSCQLSVAQRKTALTRCVPGRHCPKCGTDLTAAPGSHRVVS